MRTLLLAAALMLASGCGLRRGLTVDVCQPSESLAAQLAPLVDGVVVYRADEEVGRAGMLCAKAADTRACLDEVDRSKPTEKRHLREHGAGQLTIIITRNGVVQRLGRSTTWKDLADLPPRLRAQAFIELTRGPTPMCGGNNLAETPDGVLMLVSDHQGCFGGEDTLLLIKPDGRTETVKEKSYPRTCMG
ncbi:MAG: hypothetical protein JNM69_19340 [Archangium sp.]|nr:hypothetical protein [Archangium sp.]